jgi:Phytanoyl-CoA dioxygenase (PhyH)
MATLAIYRLCSKSDFTWRYVANLRSSLEYPWAKKKLSAPHERIVTELKRNGVAITSIGDFTESSSLFEELATTVRNYEISMAKEIEETRADAALRNRAKSYVLTLLGPVPTLDPSDIFVRFAIQPGILAIVNDYFGMLTKLRSYNVWHNFPTHAPPRESQLWHRDPEDRCVLKMFVYLTDVDEGAGPLSYAQGTHYVDAVKTAARSEILKEDRSYVHRSNDAQINELVPKNQWLTAVGPKGTIVFADTRGYHKGGFAVERERIFIPVCLHLRPASILRYLSVKPLSLGMPTGQWHSQSSQLLEEH